MDEHELDLELEHADGQLGEQLRALLDPAEDLGDRTADDVDRTLRSRSTFAAALELLGLGWWTMRSFLGDDGPDRLTDGTTPADRERGGS